MYPEQIRKVLKGEFIKRTECSNIVYVRGEYCKQSKAFACHAFADICKVVYIKADKNVFVDFTF
jgi:hypothetical protein